MYSAITFFGLINQNYCKFFEFNLGYFATCQCRQKPDKHYVTNSHKIIVDSHLASLGLYWDEIDRHVENNILQYRTLMSIAYMVHDFWLTL